MSKQRDVVVRKGGKLGGIIVFRKVISKKEKFETRQFIWRLHCPSLPKEDWYSSNSIILGNGHLCCWTETEGKDRNTRKEVKPREETKSQDEVSKKSTKQSLG